MIVTYTPEDGQPQRWQFDPGSVRSGHAEAIEKRSGLTWDEWVQAVHKGATRARRALLWHLLKRQHPTLKFEDVDYSQGELLVEMDRDELAKIRETTVKAKHLSDEDREVILARIDQEIAELADDTDETDESTPATDDGETPKPVGRGRGASTGPGKA